MDKPQTPHFNALSPSEAERLALVTEEMAEAIQIIGKIMRHGFDSSNPTVKGGETNREALTRELGDVLHSIYRLGEAGDVQMDAIEERESQKRVSIVKWLHHQSPEELELGLCLRQAANAKNTARKTQP